MRRGPYTAPTTPDAPTPDARVERVPLTFNERVYLRQLLHAWHRDHMPADAVALDLKLRDA